MKFEITFESDPGNAKVTVANLKYNKSGWASVEWDDNSPQALKGFRLLKNKTYSDGCGNNIAYTASLAVNGFNQFLCEEVAGIPENVNYNQMKELIAGGWDIVNHSYYHNPTGNCGYGENWDRNIKELDELIHKKIDYKMNGSVVPTNYSGFPTAAQKFGYLFSSSQGTFDTYAPGAVPTYKEYFNFDLAPKNFSAFGRIFYDDWAQLETSVKNALQETANRSNFYFRFASHTIDETIFSRMLNSFSTISNDRLLFISTREIMEYRIVASQPVKSEKKGNSLIVEIDGSKIPERFRWRDLSFLVTGDSKIASVNMVSGIDKTSFNPATGLVNIFKQKTAW